ncbi:MAG: hypothetical protein JWM22_2579 [Frankiales bacterium]|nr:hypothetical protein [Frankiales bacterium]
MLLVLPLLAACSTPLTPARLSGDVQKAFGGRYVSQQGLLGRTDVRASALHTLASCTRTGSAQDGPGEDWLCSVQYLDTSTAAAQTFEVQLKADGCWTATGAPATQPAQLVDPLTQQHLANPLAAFDGCLDTSWH